MFCSKCGANNNEGANFCGNCGAQLASPQPAQDTPPAAPSYQKPSGYTQHPTVPPGGSLNGGMIPPKNYMTESIIVTVVSFICCCSPISIVLGIIAIIKANNVNPKFADGHFDDAIRYAESAKKLTIWAAVIAIVWTIVYFVAYYTFLGSMIEEQGLLDGFMDNM